MIYEGVFFFSFDLVLSLVAVLIVPGGFERDCLFIAARFLPPWPEIVDPSPVFEKPRALGIWGRYLPTKTPHLSGTPDAHGSDLQLMSPPGTSR